MDTYAFTTVTGSLETLKQLVKMLEGDNNRRQGLVNMGLPQTRSLDVSAVVESPILDEILNKLVLVSAGLFR
jgi:excinuclease UvrABC helicase subunit UvrB